MGLLSKLLDRSGRPDAPPAPPTSSGFRGAVSYSSEFKRIEALPRRVFDDDLIRDITRDITDALKTPAGSMGLWDIQGLALSEILTVGGAFLPVGVGQGKSLISLLAPVVLESERPLLLVPASLRDQTLLKVLPEMSEHWRLPDGLMVMSYSELSLIKNSSFLNDYAPDLIILDECHRAKNPKAGRTRRLVRYFREHPETRCVAMSGTITTRSLTEYGHILQWCLKRSSPLPTVWRDLQDWSDALDEKVPDDRRTAPGALLRFCVEGENPRQGYRRRLVETPGVVGTSEKSLGTSLYITRRPIRVPGSIAAMIDAMRTTWTTPGGDVISEAVELWRHIRELSLGFYYRWDPEPPREWLRARSEWKGYAREVLKHNRRGLDTELQVWTECLRSENPPSVWRDWNRLNSTFSPNTISVWLDDFAIRDAVHWMSERRDDDRGIVWVESRAFGERLAKRTRRPYYGAGDSRILDTEERAIVASIAAHGEGKNLQAFSRNLITTPPTSGKVWEQLLGRTHRPGQLADEVTVEVYLHAPELEKSFGQARSDAVYLEDTVGNKQKLNYADIGDL